MGNKNDTYQKPKKSAVTKKDSFKTKLIISMLVVAAIPLIIAVVVSYITSTNKARLDAIDSLEWQAWYVQSAIGTVMQSNESAITSFADSPITIKYMKGEEVDLDDLKRQMASIDEYMGDGNVIVLSNANGQMVLRDDDSKLSDISDREYFQEAMKGKFVVSNIIVSASTGVRSISMAAPIIDPDTGRVLGTVHRNYNLNNFHTILDEECDEGFLVDRNGDLASHSNYEIKADDQTVNFSSSPYMQTDDIEGSYVSYATGIPSYVAFARDPLSGYVVCVAKSEKEIMASASRPH